MKSFKLLFCFLFLIKLIDCNLNPSVQLTDQDKFRLKSLFNLNQKLDSSTLSSIFYSLVGLNVLYNSNLNSAFESTQKKNEYCDQLKQFINQNDNQNLDNLYYVSSSLKLLNCQFDTTQLAILIEPTISSEPKIANLFKYVICLTNAGKPIQSAKIAKLTNDALAKEDSFLSTGLSLQIASKLARVDQTAFLNRIPAVIKHADEIDEKYLQYEGGLGSTVSIIKGILDLSAIANKETTGLNSLEITKFVNYFLSRLTVQTPKNGAELMEILKLLSANRYHQPVVIALYGSSIINEQNSNIVIKLTNTLGGSLAKEFKITGKLNGLSSVFKFSQVQGDSTLYAIDLADQQSKLPAGYYDLKLTVEPVKADKQLVINAAEFKIIKQSKVQLDSIEIGVGEKDQIAIKYESIEYPSSLSNVLECDYTQKISIKFCVRDQIQSKDISVQQATIYFVNEKSNEEIIFIADQDRISKVYNKDINLAYRGKEFSYESGNYLVKLVVGDSLIEQAISWQLGKLNIQFNQDASIESSWLERYLAKPEIVHQFRQPEKRPPTLVSHAFTLLCLSPILILLVCWFALGINLAKFTFSLSAILFHGSLLLVFALYTLFFIRLNMFTTCKCLSGVLATLFLSGHYLLKRLASKEKVSAK